jgi:molybdopterin/thiamine biosynthesis adenylyltransferase
MRNATILVLKLKGVATEVIKNIVLAGVGRLIVADDEDVSEEDLGAGFFFREEDVGKKVRGSHEFSFSCASYRLVPGVGFFFKQCVFC